MAERSIESRFRAKVDRRGVDECWLWRGTITVGGYGQFSVGARSAGSVRAHRFAFELEIGPIPAGLQVCHRCDVRACVNPAHLFLGTAAENQHDKGRKGRAAKGEQNGGGGKLTESDVRSIRELLATGRSRQAIGEQFGVSGTEVGFIASGRHWSHVA